MKRTILAAIGAGAALSLGAAPALASCPTNDPYPASEGWYFVDHEKTTAPAGYACNVAVSWVITGHERVLINGQPITADTPPAGPGDRIYSVSPDEHAVFKNEATGQTYRVKDDGSFLDVVKKNGRDLRSKGKGRNFYQGLGVTGILFTTKRHSVQKFTVTDYMDPVKSTLHFHKITGKQIDICHKVGAESVPGKNLPQPEAASPAKAMARVHD
jgi:hypothetical protein